MATTIRLRTLGDSTIQVGDTRIGPDSAVLFGLLLYLAVERGKPVPRGRLRELFWPEVPESKAWHSLRQLLYRMRQLGIEVEATASHIALDAGAVEADFAAFGGLNGAAARPAMAPGQTGVFLAGYAPRFSEPFATWVDEQRSIVHAKLRRALLDTISAQRVLGDWTTIERAARDILAIDPLNEEAILSLAEATALSGSKVEAVALLDRYVAELGDLPDRHLEVAPKILRRRIAERLPDSSSVRSVEGAFVGREESMAQLYRAMQETRSGDSRSCHVWGPPGIGKSRLVEEFTRLAVLQGVRIERVACQTSDRRRPMSVFAELVPRLLSLPGALGCSPESLELLKRLSAHDTNAGLTAVSAEADVLSSSIRGALNDLLDAISSEGTAVIVVEDIHWADDRSRRMLRDLAEWAGSRRVAFLCTSREAPEGSGVAETAHELVRLDAGAIRALIGSLMTQARDPDSVLIDRCIRISEGNPLYAKALVEYWQVTGDTDGIPPTISTLLSGRIAELSSECIVALQAIAILGRQATATRLAAMLEFRSHELVRVLESLASHRLIAGERDRFASVHELVAHAALSRMTDIGLRSLHRLAARTLGVEAVGAVDVSVLWDCAEHWKEAAEPERAIRFALDCAKHLLELGLPNDASELLMSAKAYCDDPATYLELLGTLAIALQHAAQWGQLVDVLNEKLRLSAGGKNSPAQRDEDELLLLEASYSAEIEEMSDVARQAARYSVSNASANHRLRSICLCLVIHSETGDREAAEQVYASAAPLFANTLSDQGLLCEVEVLYQTIFGDVTRGALAAENLLAFARAHSAPQALARALRFAAVAFRMAGHLADAQAALEEALEVAEHFKLSSQVLAATGKIALLKLAANDFDAAVVWAERAVTIAPKNCPPMHLLEPTVTIIEANLALGNIATARRVYSSIENYSIGYECRGATAIAALRVRMSIESGGFTPDQRDVRSLLESYSRLRDKGDQDFVVSSLFRALSALGDRARAEQTLKDYLLCHRRDRSPLLTDLRHAAEAFDWAPDIYTMGN